jgi:hypothetical protein
MTTIENFTNVNGLENSLTYTKPGLYLSTNEIDKLKKISKYSKTEYMFKKNKIYEKIIQQKRKKYSKQEYKLFKNDINKKSISKKYNNFIKLNGRDLKYYNRNECELSTIEVTDPINRLDLNLKKYLKWYCLPIKNMELQDYINYSIDTSSSTDLDLISYYDKIYDELYSDYYEDCYGDF